MLPGRSAATCQAHLHLSGPGAGLRHLEGSAGVPAVTCAHSGCTAHLLRHTPPRTPAASFAGPDPLPRPWQPLCQCNGTRVRHLACDSCSQPHPASNAEESTWRKGAPPLLPEPRFWRAARGCVRDRDRAIQGTPASLCGPRWGSQPTVQSRWTYSSCPGGPAFCQPPFQTAQVGSSVRGRGRLITEDPHGPQRISQLSAIYREKGTPRALMPSNIFLLLFTYMLLNIYFKKH